MKNAVVSFVDEPLILVDSQDRETGFMPKEAAHLGAGVLHRAFSVFLFNDKGEVLLQKRAANKMLWGGYWSNSVCSHPRKGETVEAAARRRVEEELGVICALEYLYKFEYQAQFGDVGSENELCSVLIGRVDQPVTANENEIAEWKWMAREVLSADMDKNPDAYTPWLKMEWRELMDAYNEKIEKL